MQAMTGGGTAGLQGVCAWKPAGGAAAGGGLQDTPAQTRLTVLEGTGHKAVDIDSPTA